MAQRAEFDWENQISDPGEFKNLVIFERRSAALNEFGAKEPAWFEFARAWCRIRAMKATERFDVDQQYTRQLFEFKMSWISTIANNQHTNTEARINYNNNYYDIQSIQDLGERRQTLIIIAEESRGGV